MLVARTEASCGSAVAGAGDRALTASRLRRHFGTNAPCLSSASCRPGSARVFAFGFGFGFGFGGAGAVDCTTGAGVGVDSTAGGFDVLGGGEDWVGVGSGAGSGAGSGLGVGGSGAGSAPLATGTKEGAVSPVASATAMMPIRTRPRPRCSACGGTPTGSPCPCRPLQRYTTLRLWAGSSCRVRGVRAPDDRWAEIGPSCE